MDLTSILGLLGNLPALLGLIDNIAFIMLCFFFGSFAFNGWKRYKNYGIKLLGSVTLGFACLFGSIMFEPFMPFKLPFLSGAIPAFITAVMLYIILLLLSGSAQAATKYVKSESYEELMEKFNSLVDEVKRLKAVLKRKDIVPTELTIKQLEKELNSQLSNREIKHFRVLSKKRENDVMNFIVKSKKNQYKAGFDMFTGELLGFEQTNLTFSQKIVAGLHYLGNNKRVLAGIVLTALLASFMLSQVDNETISVFNQRLQFTMEGVQAAQTGGLFTNYSISDDSCLSVTDLLYAYTKGSLIQINQTGFSSPNIESEISAYAPEFVYPLFYDYQGTAYGFIALFSISSEEFMGALIGDNLLSLIGGFGSFDLCSTDYQGSPLSSYITLCNANIDSDELCECTEMSALGPYCEIASGIITNDLISQGLGMLG